MTHENYVSKMTPWEKFMLKCRGGNLLCPVCGFDYVHVTEIEAHPVGKTKQYVSATEKGVTMFHSAAVDGFGRGNDVIVTFQCESGHEFSYKFGFHKGQTPFEMTVRELEEGEEIALPLWRD